MWRWLVLSFCLVLVVVDVDGGGVGDLLKMRTMDMPSEEDVNSCLGMVKEEEVDGDVDESLLKPKIRKEYFKGDIAEGVASLNSVDDLITLNWAEKKREHLVAVKNILVGYYETDEEKEMWKNTPTFVFATYKIGFDLLKIALLPKKSIPPTLHKATTTTGVIYIPSDCILNWEAKCALHAPDSPTDPLFSRKFTEWMSKNMKASFRIINKLPYTLTLEWITEGWTRTALGTIQPGQSKPQSTSLGHIFQILKDGVPIGLEVVSKASDRWLITSETILTEQHQTQNDIERMWIEAREARNQMQSFIVQKITNEGIRKERLPGVLFDKVVEYFRAFEKESFIESEVGPCLNQVSSRRKSHTQ